MSPAHSSRRLFPAFLLLGAFLLRLVYLFEARQNPFFDAPVVDARVFLEQALQIAGGNWMGGTEPFWQAPLYIYFLSLLCRLFPAHYFIAIRLIQALIGSLSCLLVYRIAGRIAGRRIAVIAALMAAAYAPFLYFEGELLAVPLEIFLDLLLLYRLLIALETDRDREWILVGLIGGLAALTRPNILLFLCAFPLWHLVRERRASPTTWPLRPISRGLLILLPLSLVVLPVTLRNYLLEPDIVFISANGGINFYIGNNPDYERTVSIHPGMEWEAMVDEPARADITTAAGKSAFFFRKSFAYILSSPGDYLLLLGKKLWLFWSGPEIKRNQDIYYARTYSHLLSLLLWERGLAFPFGLLAPLMLLGLWLTRKGGEIPLVLLRLYILTYMISVLLFFVTARYRLPVVPVLLVFAAWALLHLWKLVAQRRYLHLSILAVPLIVLLVLLNLRQAPAPSQDAQLYFDLGEVNLRKGNYRKAIDYSLLALELEPTYNYARHNLAVAYFHIGRYQDAIRSGLQAASENPLRPDTRILLGKAFTATGHYEQGMEQLQQALRIDPESGMAHYYLGRLQLKQGRALQAVPHLEEATSWQPGDPWIHYDLGQAYQQSGRLEEALRQFMRSYQLAAQPEAANAIGAVYLLQNDPVSARDYFSRALTLRPDYPEAQINLALIDLNQQRTDQAIARLERLLDSHPDSLPAHRALLEAYLRTGQRRQARELEKRLENLSR